MRRRTSTTTRLLAKLLAIATLVGVVSALQLASPSGAASTSPALVPTAGRLAGLSIDNTQAVDKDTYKNAVDRRELDAGRKVDVLATQPYPFTNTFPSWRESWMQTTGHIPLIDWLPGYSPAVAAGQKDAVLDARAADLKAFGSRVFLRYAPSMDKADPATTSSPASFAAAWRRVRDRFSAAGVTNVVWVWCPSTDAFTAGTAMSWYPGDGYVDWTCAEGRNLNAPWTPFGTLFRSFVDATSAKGKPQMALFGSVEGSTGTAKATWIEWAYKAIASTYPTVKAAIYDDRGTTSLSTSSAAAAAFGVAVKDSSMYVKDAVTLAPGKLAPASGAYVGTYEKAGTQSAELADLSALESAMGRKEDIAHHFYSWGDTFPTWRESTDLANGRIPLVSWGGVNTTQINSGQYDAMIRTRAQAMKALSGQVMLRWFWEMDGAANAATAVSAPSYVAAWQRIHSIFVQEGATNVAWVWAPNAWGFEGGEAKAFYPGDANVDWIAADGYNWAPLRTTAKWVSFTNTFSAWYAWAGTRSKPLMIAETGTAERNPGEKAQWIKDAGTSLQVQMPKVRAMVWFDEPTTSYTDGSTVFPWQLTTSSSSMAAWKSIVALPQLTAVR